MRIWLAALLLLTLSAPAFATAQLPERIVIDGVQEKLLAEPLDQALEADPQLAARFYPLLPKGICTAVWRGYVATWAVRDDRLYLDGIDVNACASANPLPLEQIFGTSGPVPATWFSGRLTVAQGKQQLYIHMGFQSRYERYLILTVEKGVVTGRETRDEP
jgi:hypothetical protein